MTTSSSVNVQGSYPLCTVTIYNAGTVVLSTIYEDDGVTPKANPFTANSDGSWNFYAATGYYDVKFSGTGITAPFTLGYFHVGSSNLPTGAPQVVTGIRQGNPALASLLTGLATEGLVTNNTTAGAPLAVAGTRQGNAALASALTQLATLGLITDGTTAGTSPLTSNPYINACDYGFSTAATAANNAIYLQLALDACRTTGFKHLYIPAGTYSVGAAVAITDSITISGSGPGATILKTTVASQDLFHVNDCPKISDITPGATTTITTTENHGFITGDTVVIYGLCGITGIASGTSYVITRTGAKTFTLDGAAATAGAYAPLTVTNATNARPIVVTTAAHGLSTSHMCWIEGVAGNSATDASPGGGCNGPYNLGQKWWIERVDNTNVKLGYDGSGEYTSVGTGLGVSGSMYGVALKTLASVSVTIHGMTISSGISKTGGAGIRLGAGVRHNIHDLYVEDQFDAIYNECANRTKIIGSDFLYNTGSYAAVSSGSFIRLTNFYSMDTVEANIVGNSFWVLDNVATRYSIIMSSVGGNRIVGNKILGGRYGILVVANAYNTSDLIIEGNSIEIGGTLGPSIAAIKLDGTYYVTNVQICNNQFAAGPPSGFVYVTGAYVNQGTIVGNNFTNTVAGTDPCLKFTAGTDFIIQGNMFRCAVGYTGPAISIGAGATRISPSLNYFHDIATEITDASNTGYALMGCPIQLRAVASASIVSPFLGMMILDGTDFKFYDGGAWRTISHA